MSSKKLIIYVDSYAEDPNLVSWASQLAAKLKIPMLNRGISGTSIEYSIKYFIKDKLSNTISHNDTVIFIFSSPGRHHLKYQNKFPRTASIYSYGRSSNGHNVNDITYYQENKEHIKWYEANKDDDIFKVNASSYLHMLINYARSKPDVTFMVLYMDILLHPIELPILDNFLISNISLRQLSDNEFGCDVYFHSFVKKVIADPRYNHLTIPNISIFADLIHKAILTKDTSIITYDKFLRGILDKNLLSQKDYLYFIDRGLLYNNERYMDRLR